MIDDRVVGPVKFGGQVGLRDRHAHPVGKSLPQRAGSGFDAGGHAVFRVAWRPGTPLAEVFQIIQAEIVTGQVKQRIELH